MNYVEYLSAVKF